MACQRHVKLGHCDFVTNHTHESLRTKLRKSNDTNQLTYVKYHMGNGRLPITDPEEAAKLLIKREYPRLYEVDQKWPTFIPPIFVGKDPELVENLDQTKRSQIVDEMQKGCDNEIIQNVHRKLYDVRRGTWGSSRDPAEKIVFDTLEEIFKNDGEESADIIVLHGLDVLHRDAKRGESRYSEHDFIICSSNRMLFSPLEVKTSWSPRNYRKASEQAEKFQVFLEKYFSDILGNNGWQFCHTIYFLDLSLIHI